MAQVKAGELADAEKTASTIKDDRLQDAVLGAIVDSRRSGSGDLNLALATARRMSLPANQGRALRDLAILQANRGDIDGALATARSIVHDVFNALALGDVAVVAARVGNVAEARQLAARIRDDSYRGRALAEIAGVQAEAGQLSSAMSIADEIEDKLQRAGALGSIAAARAAGGIREARPSCSRKRWPRSRPGAARTAKRLNSLKWPAPSSWPAIAREHGNR